MNRSLSKELYTQWPPTCFGQPREHPQGCKTQRVDTYKAKLPKNQKQSTLMAETCRRSFCHT